MTRHDQRSTPTLKSKMGRGYRPVNKIATPATIVSSGYTKYRSINMG